MAWYYILGIISYGIFIVQSLLSSLGLFEGDIDFDGDSDFSASDLLSFKGLIHFAMGFSGWFMLSDEITVFTYIMGVIIGLIFTVSLCFIYKTCMKFNSIPTVKQGKDLIGTPVKVSIVYPNGKCLGYLPNYSEITCKTNRDVHAGDILNIISYESGIYHIS